MRRYTITLSNYTLPLSVGIYAKEKEHQQPVNCHITMIAQCPETIHDINDVYNYEHLIATLKTVGQQQHYDLLEQLSDALAKNYQANAKVESLEITLIKPNIINPPAAISITMRYGKAF